MALTTDVLAKLVVSNPATGQPVAGFSIGDDFDATAGVARISINRDRVPIPDDAR